MEMQQEMMSDAIDAGMDNAEDVDSADKIYAQICEEIGIEVAEENDVNAGPVKQKVVGGVSLFLYLKRNCRKWRSLTIYRQD